MEAKLILYPVAAMVLLVSCVAVVMLRGRIAAMKAGRIHPQKVALSGQMAALITDTRAADNFRNLFETPVLFYVAVVVIYITQLTSPLYLALAWGYVAARVVHSLIHCGPNVVMRRFYAYLTSLIILVATWISIVLDLAVFGRG